MRALLLLLVVGATAITVGCPGHNNVECVNNSSCDLSTGGVCTASSSGNTWCAYPDASCPSGMRYSDQDVGDGVGGQCVPVQQDAGMDGASLVHDAMPDAPPNCPQAAPVQNGQAADLELGQPGFTSGSANNPFRSGSSLATSVGLYSDGTRLWVADSGNARVLQWNSFPAVNGQAANIAIGQPDLINLAAGTDQSHFSVGGSFIARAGTKLVISDSVNNRVLIWNSIPTASGQGADLVLGQTTFTTKTNGNAATQLYAPRGVWTDGTKLIVADRFNNRLLIWNTFPTANDAAADVVLGATDFGMTPNISPPTASSVHNPAGIFVRGGKLYVADEGNNRVLIWNSIPTANNAPADVVLGQSGFDGYFNNGGAPYPQVNAVGMKGPFGVVVDECNSLYVCDALNGRVMVYTQVPTTNGAAADAVLGKPDATTQPNAGTAPSASWMAGCSGFGLAGASLYVGDDFNNRVLRFSLSR